MKSIASEPTREQTSPVKSSGDDDVNHYYKLESRHKSVERILSKCDSELGESMSHRSLSSKRNSTSFLKGFEFDHFKSIYEQEQDKMLRDHIREVDYSEPASMKVLY